MQTNWYLTSWEIEWLPDCIAFVGYIYNHLEFIDGQKVYIKIPPRITGKYKRIVVYD